VNTKSRIVLQTKEKNTVYNVNLDLEPDSTCVLTRRSEYIGTFLLSLKSSIAFAAGGLLFKFHIGPVLDPGPDKIYLDRWVTKNGLVH